MIRWRHDKTVASLFERIENSDPVVESVVGGLKVR